MATAAGKIQTAKSLPKKLSQGQLMTEQQSTIDSYERQRTCKECGTLYTIEEFVQSSGSNFNPPDRYSEGCHDYCLACWLGVGPNDLPPLEDHDSGTPRAQAKPS